MVGNARTTVAPRSPGIDPLHASTSSPKNLARFSSVSEVVTGNGTLMVSRPVGGNPRSTRAKPGDRLGHQRGADQQDQRERDLGDDEHAAGADAEHASPPLPGSPSVAPLWRRRSITAGLSS